MTDSFVPPPLHIPFDPVPVAARHDGWTAAKQRALIDALVRFGCVAAAARFVGMTPRSAHRLRRRSDAASFAAAWDKALNEGRRNILESATERAIHGERIPIFYGGRQVGVRIHYDHRLAIAVIKHDTAACNRLASSHTSGGSTEFARDIW